MDHDTIASDDELTALAMAADPDQPVDADAIPISFSNASTDGLLPGWYMPAPSAAVKGWRRWVVGAFGLALVAVNCAGLCVTYGFPEIAW